MAKKKSRDKKTEVVADEGLRQFVKALADRDDVDDALDALDLILENGGDDIGERLARLAVYDLDPMVSQGAVGALALGLDNHYYDLEEVSRLGRHVGPVVLKALENPKVPDSRKVDIVRICELSGWLPEDANLGAYFADLGGTMRRMMEKGLEDFTGSPEDVSSAILGLLEQDDEEIVPIVTYATVCEMAKHVAQKQPVAAAGTMAAAIVFGVDSELDPGDITVTLNALDKLANPEAVWWLEALAKWPGIGKTGEEARRMAVRRRMEGIEPACRFSPRFKTALVTAQDALGTSQVIYIFDGVTDGADAICVLVRDDDGIADTFVAYGEGEAVTEKTRELGNGIPTAYSSREVADDFLADALAITEEHQHRLPLALFISLPYLGGALPAAKRRTPVLDAYDHTVSFELDDLKDVDKATRESAEYLMEFCSDITYAFLEVEGPKRGKTLKDPLLTRFLQSVEFIEKPVLIRRAQSYLEVEALAGRADAARNQYCFRTLLALNEGSPSFATIPAVRWIGTRSASLILQYLRQGYRNQQEVNEALAMEMLDED